MNSTGMNPLDMAGYWNFNTFTRFPFPSSEVSHQDEGQMQEAEVEAQVEAGEESDNDDVVPIYHLPAQIFDDDEEDEPDEDEDEYASLRRAGYWNFSF